MPAPRFQSTTDVCNAIPSGRPKTGYTLGPMVVVAQGLKSRTLTPNDIISNSPTNVQRLFLVKSLDEVVRTRSQQPG